MSGDGGPLLGVRSQRQEILDWHASLTRRDDAELLGVDPCAPPSIVSEAFFRLVARFHPSALATANADLREQQESIYRRLSAAYEKASRRSGCRPAEDQEPAVSAHVERRRAEVSEALDTAQRQLERREPAGAITTLHRVIRLAEGDQRPRARLLLARAYAAEPRRSVEAKRLLREILHEQPRDAEALVILARLYARDGLLARAEQTLRHALEAAPVHMEAQLLLSAVRTARARRGGGPAGVLARMLPGKLGRARGEL